MAKKKKQTQESEQSESPSFEEALAQLQEIVNELDQGAIGLEESMRRFEAGIKLLRTCYKILETAEQKIEVLTGIDAEGNPSTVDFDASATADGAVRTAGKRKAAANKNTAPTDSQETEEDQGTDATLF